MVSVRNRPVVVGWLTGCTVYLSLGLTHRIVVQAAVRSWVFLRALILLAIHLFGRLAWLVLGLGVLIIAVVSGRFKQVVVGRSADSS